MGSDQSVAGFDRWLGGCSDPAWVTRAGRLLTVNAALARRVGGGPAHPEAWVDRAEAHLFHADSTPDAPMLRRADGAGVPVALSTWQVELSDGAATVVVARLLEAQRRSEADAVLDGRVRYFEVTAASVAHELNNPLSFLFGNLEFAQTRLRDAPETDEFNELGDLVREATVGADRLRKAISELALWSRDDRPPRDIDLNRAVHVAFGLVKADIRPRARVELDLQPVPPVKGSGARVTQLLSSLLVQAAHVVPDGHPADHAITVSTRTTAHGGACLEVRHIGRVERAPSVDDERGVGAALGLAACARLSRELGGDLEVLPHAFRLLVPGR